MSQLIYYAKTIIEGILPSFISRFMEIINPKPLHEKIRQYYIDHGYRWDDEINIMTVRNTDNPNTYNDIHVIENQGELYFIWGTSEPGRGWTEDKMKKYGVSWVGLYPLGFYTENFKVGNFHGRALRQIGKVMLMEIEDDKPVGLRKGGGCHFHRRFSSGESVDISSAGCQVPQSEHGMDMIMDIVMATSYYQKNKKHLFDYMIADIKQFPSLAGQQIVRG